jgi:putative transposase
VLREAESGTAVVEVCRKHGISQQSFYLWKKYAGLGLNELRELRQLREENGKLKRLVADLGLDRHILQGDRRKKVVKPRARRQLAEWTQQVYELSQRHAARLIPIPRMTLRYEHHRERHEALRARLRESLEEKCRIVELTLVPGASVARIAQAEGVNANQVFLWRRAYRKGELLPGSALLPVVIEADGSGCAISRRTWK